MCLHLEAERARQQMDYSYHHRYGADRLVDVHKPLIQQSLSTDVIRVDPLTCECGEEALERPVIVFLAGPYGSGKSHLLRHPELSFRLSSLVPSGRSSEWLHIDPDAVRRRLPELPQYLREDPWTAGARTHAEATYIAETLERLALSRGLNIIVDGSLQDAAWFREVHWPWIRQHHAQYRIGVWLVQAEWPQVLERCLQRCEETRRCIPLSRIREAYERLRQATSDGVFEVPGLDEFLVLRN